MKQRAEEADLIIVNHHLFFADLAIRQEDFGSILPEYSAVVFDEAHEIEDVASDYFGRQLSSYRFEELARDTEGMCADAANRSGAAAPAPGAHARTRREHSSRIFRNAKGAYPFGPAERQAFLDRNRESYDEVLAAIKRIEAELSALTPEAGRSDHARATRLRNAPRVCSS